MTKTHRSPTIGRRDALGLIAATVVADAVLSGPVQACGSAAGLTAAPQLADLTAEHFEPLVGQGFTVGDSVMTLRQVRRGHDSGAQFRQQFGIVFDAPRQPTQSEVLPLAHMALGRHDVLVSPVGAGSGASLEIYFA
jgi:hypothetical protein